MSVAKGAETKRGFTAYMQQVYTEPNTGCWLWPGNVNARGYGLTKIFGKQSLAHRVSYERNVGPIPDGLCVLHNCDVPLCVNPSHLRAGTHQENMTDMARRKRRYKGGRKPRQSSGPVIVKLTPDMVRAIRLDSRKQSVIAAELRVDPSLISRVKSRHFWGHVE